MTTETTPTPPRGRPETPQERADRNFEGMLAELRVALPGVQVLFAFLLVVPFSARFDRVTPFQEKVYFGTLVCTALASALLIAPSMYHRLVFQRGDKPHIVEVSNILAIIGLTLLAVAMCGAIVLITDYVFGTVATIVTAVAVSVTFLAFWYVMPLNRRRVIARRERRGERDDASRD